MYRYFALFLDAFGKTLLIEQMCASDDDAKNLFNGIAGKSNASWKKMFKESDVIVDGGTYTNYNLSGRPVEGCSNRSKGTLTWAVGSNRNKLRASIPAVDRTYLSPANRRVTVDPCSGLANLTDEEGAAPSAFLSGVYAWTPSKKA